MKEETLKEIGLTESEIKVYLALLELGDSTRSDIVYKSRIAGSKIYEVLERLQEKGLVSIYIQNKVKHFKPTNPNQILNYVEEKKKAVTLLEEDTKNILPKLFELYSSSKEEQEVELLIGLKGLEIIFREQVDLLKKGDVCYVIGGTKGSDEKTIQSFFEKIHVMREGKGIYTKMLYNISQKDIVENAFNSKKFKLTSTRYISHAAPVAINIYKDRTAIIIFGKVITTILITSKPVAHSFEEYFNLLWKSS